MNTLNTLSLNPLNQVYVFNLELQCKTLPALLQVSLNPLNQVYVFNSSFRRKEFFFL